MPDYVFGLAHHEIQFTEVVPGLHYKIHSIILVFQDEPDPASCQKEDFVDRVAFDIYVLPFVTFYWPQKLCDKRDEIRLLIVKEFDLLHEIQVHHHRQFSFQVVREVLQKVLMFIKVLGMPVGYGASQLPVEIERNPVVSSNVV